MKMVHFTLVGEKRKAKLFALVLPSSGLSGIRKTFIILTSDRTKILYSDFGISPEVNQSIVETISRTNDLSGIVFLD